MVRQQFNIVLFPLCTYIHNYVLYETYAGTLKVNGWMYTHQRAQLCKTAHTQVCVQDQQDIDPHTGMCEPSE